MTDGESKVGGRLRQRGGLASGMFNDPEWASKEEWEAYAWFGYAMSEAQIVERHLHVIAVALSLAQREGDPSQSDWIELYDKLGELTLGKFLCHIRQYAVIPEDLMAVLKEAVKKRNALAHEFFWPQKSSGAGELAPEEATRELQKAASLFSNLSTRLESVMWDVLGKTNLDRTEVEKQAANALGTS
jgi:hypothetical protein